jgi:hypothetical protein
MISRNDYRTEVAINGYHEGLLDEEKGLVYDSLFPDPVGIPYPIWIGPAFRVGDPPFDTVGKMFLEAESAGIGRIRRVQTSQVCEAPGYE